MPRWDSRYKRIPSLLTWTLPTWDKVPPGSRVAVWVSRPRPNEVTLALPATGDNVGGVGTIIKLSPEVGAAGALLCGGEERAGRPPPFPGHRARHLLRWSCTCPEPNAGRENEWQGRQAPGCTASHRHLNSSLRRAPSNSRGRAELEGAAGPPRSPPVRTSTCREGDCAGSTMPAPGGGAQCSGDPPWPPRSRGLRQRAGGGPRRRLAVRGLRTQVRLPAKHRWPCPRAVRQGSPRGERGGERSVRTPRAGRGGGGRGATPPPRAHGPLRPARL